MISVKENTMNTSNVPTAEKVMITLRLAPDTYTAMIDQVRDKKDNVDRGYSINQFVTDVIEDALGIKRF